MSRLSRESPVLCAVALTVGFALFQSARSGELASTSDHAMGFILISRFVGIATFIVVAILFFWRAPSIRQTLTIAVPFMTAYCLVMLIVPSLDDDALGITVLYAVGMLHGIASALCRIVFLMLFASFAPKYSAVLLGASNLASNLLLFIFSSFDSTSISWVREFFLFTGMIFMLFVVHALKQQDTTRGAGKSKWFHVEGWKREPRPTFPSNRTEWFLLLTAAFLFSTIFGFIAQVASSGNPDSFALYDVSTNVILVVINVLLLAFLCLAGDRFSFEDVVLLVGVLYASGCALYPFLLQMGSPLAGALIRGGFDSGSILLWILMARKVYEQPERGYGYFGILFCLCTVYPGRAIGLLFLPENVNVSAEIVAAVSIVALWVICLFGIAAYYLVSKERWILARSSVRHRGSAAEELDSRVSNSQFHAHEETSEGGELDKAQVRVFDFELQIEEFLRDYKLSKREQEVLVETLHGRSRAAIAEKLYLSPGTVKTYLSRIYDKAGVSSKQELIDLLEKRSNSYNDPS